MNPWLKAWWLTLLVGVGGTVLAVALLTSASAADPHAHGEAHADAGEGGDHGHAGDAEEHGPSATQIAPAAAAAARMRLEQAGSATLERTLELTGTVQADPDRIAAVRPRYPGIVRSVGTRIGERVEIGAPMAVVESNDSLQRFRVTAPISGVVLSRDVQVGQVVGDAPLFRIVDTSGVWIQLDVFGRDLAEVREGQDVHVETLDGYRLDGTIDWLSPLVAHGSQSSRARVVAANPDARLRPGQFVSAQVVIERIPVPLAIDRLALQTHDGERVVFVREGDRFEARPVRLGRSDRTRVEVLEGLAPGEDYVVEGSYVVKADLEKASAAHHH